MIGLQVRRIVDYQTVIDEVREAVSQTLEMEGVELVELSWRRFGRTMVLRFLVDKQGGITIDECGRLNQTIGEILDAKDLIQDRYTLEVSSPGLDRPLQTKRDFERNIGRKVKIFTKMAPTGTEQVQVGKLCEVDEQNIVIIGKDGTHKIVPLGAIQKAKLEVEF